MSDVNPEIGKRYVMRYGGVSGVIRTCDFTARVFPLTDGAHTFSLSGRQLGAEVESKFDLVGEFNPAEFCPLEWKRGVPTVHECRDLWLLSGGCGDVPTAQGCIYEPNETDTGEWDPEEWYVAVMIKPSDQLNPKVIIQRRWVFDRGEAWIDDTVSNSGLWPGLWTRTDQTREVPREQNVPEAES